MDAPAVSLDCPLPAPSLPLPVLLPPSLPSRPGEDLSITIGAGNLRYDLRGVLARTEGAWNCSWLVRANRESADSERGGRRRAGGGHRAAGGRQAAGGAEADTAVLPGRVYGCGVGQKRHRQSSVHSSDAVSSPGIPAVTRRINPASRRASVYRRDFTGFITPTSDLCTR